MHFKKALPDTSSNYLYSNSPEFLFSLMSHFECLDFQPSKKDLIIGRVDKTRFFLRVKNIHKF
jgi:hypothetical protein